MRPCLGVRSAWPCSSCILLWHACMCARHTDHLLARLATDSLRASTPTPRRGTLHPGRRTSTRRRSEVFLQLLVLRRGCTATRRGGWLACVERGLRQQLRRPYGGTWKLLGLSGGCSEQGVCPRGQRRFALQGSLPTPPAPLPLGVSRLVFMGRGRFALLTKEVRWLLSPSRKRGSSDSLYGRSRRAAGRLLLIAGSTLACGRVPVLGASLADREAERRPLADLLVA